MSYDEMFAAMEDVVAMCNGLKNRFMAEGWSEPGAEHLVIALVKKGSN